MIVLEEDQSWEAAVHSNEGSPLKDYRASISLYVMQLFLIVMGIRLLI